MPRPPLRVALFALALVLGTALDLGSKEAAFKSLQGAPGCSRAVAPFLSFSLATNYGAAFGLFQEQHTFFMVVSLVAFVAVPYAIHVMRPEARLVPVVLGLILAGVCGNFWDRVVYGHVRDFIDFHAPAGTGFADLCMRWFDTTRYPTFNAADIFITCGAIGLVLVYGRTEKKPVAAAAAPGSAQPTAQAAGTAEPGAAGPP